MVVDVLQRMGWLLFDHKSAYMKAVGNSKRFVSSHCSIAVILVALLCWRVVASGWVAGGGFDYIIIRTALSPSIYSVERLLCTLSIHYAGH